MKNVRGFKVDGTDKVQTNVVRLRSHDCIDESIKLFSSISDSKRLPKNYTDDFSWPKDAMVVIKNLSEQDCSLSIEMLRTDSEFVVLRSSRGPAKSLFTGISSTHVLHAGEAWTLRSCDALTPVGRLSV